MSSNESEERSEELKRRVLSTSTGISVTSVFEVLAIDSNAINTTSHDSLCSLQGRERL